MTPQTVALENVRIVSAAPEPNGLPYRGLAMRQLRVIQSGHVIVRGGRILHVGETPAADSSLTQGGTRIDGRGRVLMSALVDCHTHACWSGDRWQEWDLKRAGTAYLEILRQGGGIMATVNAVRQTHVDALANALAERLNQMRYCGTGAVEVKTGYGLDAVTELKMLDAIRKVAGVWPAPVVATLLAGHAFDTGNPRQLDEMVALLPKAAERSPGIAVDAFCEEGAWTVAMCRTLFERARDLRMPIRVHADQFNALGGLELALEFKARSVDHLEASTPTGLRTLARSGTIGVALPVCGFALDGRYADVRALIDEGGAVALASNWNPGSAPSPSAAFAGALACRFMRVTPPEAITALTWNAACVLGLQRECGAVAPGYRSDLILLNDRDERALVYGVADAGPDLSLLGTDLQVRRA